MQAAISANAARWELHNIPERAMQIHPGASDVLCSGKESVGEASAKKIDR